MNIERYLTEHQQGTHRQIFRLLRQGRVMVNDRVIDSPRTTVDEIDQVSVDGVAVTGHHPQYLIVNKPMGVTNDLDPTVAHSIGELLNVLDRQEQFQVVADLPKEAGGVVLMSDDYRLLDDVQAADWVSRLTIQLVGTTIPAELANPVWTVTPPQVDPRRQRMTITVTTTELPTAVTALAALPNVTGPVNRVAYGPLALPIDLPVGTYRELQEDEIDRLITPLDHH